QIDVVEIQLEDLVLVEGPLDLPRYAGFQDLPPEVPFRVRQPLGEEVARQLLRDRAASLLDLTRPDVPHEGGDGAPEVDARVAVEPPVLDRDEGLGDVRGKGIQ